MEYTDFFIINLYLINIEIVSEMYDSYYILELIILIFNLWILNLHQAQIFSIHMH